MNKHILAKQAEGKEIPKAVKGKNFSNVKSTLIIFSASWAPNCYFTYPMWVRFSNRFTTEKVRIIEIDCTGGAALSKLVKAFKINTKGVAN